MTALVAAAALALVALVAEKGIGPGSRWRAGAMSAAGDGVSSFVANHVGVVTALARHFQEWEALVPEALERSLRVFGERRTALRRLFVADREGRIVAAFDSGASVGDERRLLGGMDPSGPRLQALLARPAPYERAVAEAGTVSRLELAAPILAADGTLRGYVGADLELRVLCERLSQLEAQSGLLVGLFDERGRVVCPPNRIPPSSGERRPVGLGMVLVMRVPWWRRLVVPAGVLLILAVALGGVALGRRRTAGATEPRSPTDRGGSRG